MISSDPKITVYGGLWCPDCRRAKQFLGEHQIPYHWIDIEQDREAEAVVLALNEGKRIIPTIVFEDGSLLVEPSNAELASKLGLRTEASMDFYDLIVVGGGPAGLTAALYAAREGMQVLVIERAAFGGQAAATQLLDNMPGFPQGVGGGEFSERLRQQADRFGVELLQAQDVKGMREIGNLRCVRTRSDVEYGAHTFLIATGSRYKRLGVPGEDDFIGAGVFVFIGLTPNTKFLKNKGVITDPWGFVVTGHDLVHDGTRLPGFGGREPASLETSIPGVFAAGDVRAGSTKQVASAAGEGAAAALQIREYLKHV